MCSGTSPRELSNGQKQRTALARALVRGPGVLLLDDPLRNVDAKLRYEMRLELPRLLRSFGSTVLYVTQDYKEAMALGDRIAVLRSRARSSRSRRPSDIYDEPAIVEIARLFGDPTINLYPLPARGRGRRGRRSSSSARSGGCAGTGRGRRPRLPARHPARGRPHRRRAAGPGAVAGRARRGDAAQRAHRALSARPATARRSWRPCRGRRRGRFGRGHRPVWARSAGGELPRFDPASGERLAPAAA